jgi:phosphopantetheine adenylyltransferase
MGLGEQIAARRQADRKMISVYEWGEDGEPLVIYSGPITAGDIDKLQRKHKDFLNNMTINGMVDLIIAKAEDADGKRLFTLEDKMYLMKESVALIADIAAQMFNGTMSIEDAEKN